MWDFGAGRFASFELTSESELTIVMEWNQGGVEIELEIELSGTHRLGAEASE